MKGQKPKKLLVILPPGDIEEIENHVSEGRYVTKSDFIRIAVKQLLQEDRRSGGRAAGHEAAILTRESILKTLRANNGRIKEFGVEEIGLFGSYARNEQAADSDIDIIADFTEGRKSFSNYMKLKLFLERIFRKKVDLVMKGAVRPELKKEIMESVIYA